jgi:hypothetical protein
VTLRLVVVVGVGVDVGVEEDTESAMKGTKILLVDDEPDITTTFKLTLESAGFIVDTY